KMDTQKNMNLQNNISFLRIRPCDSDNEIYLNSRKKEGTSSFYIDKPVDLEKIHKKDFQTISDTKLDESFQWFVTYKNWKEFEDVDSHRIVYRSSNNLENDIEAITRLNPSFVLLTDLENIKFLKSIQPSLNFKISKYVNSIEEAKESMAKGVQDLWLRDWSYKEIKELKNNSNFELFERTLFSLVDVNKARKSLSKIQFTNFLQLRDVRGYKRFPTNWSPGSGKEIPKLNGLTYNVSSSFKSTNFEKILSKAQEGNEISNDELEELFKTSGKYINKIAEVADNLNRSINKDDVTFVKNRNINYTNQCYFKCGFCGFSKGPKSLNLKEKPYNLEPQEVVKRSVEAFNDGASEVCLQGGIHPEYTGKFYLELVKQIKKEVPDLHIHGFTPLEIWQGAETINLSIEDYLILLKDAGLNTLPGTAAEILDNRIRKYLCPDKITSEQWGYVMEVAHSLEIKSTATIMFGHIDDIKSWVNHFDLIKRIQKRTKGFTEIVPLPFVHMGSPIFLQGKSMPGPTWDEVTLIHALARIYFHGSIDNIQASWVKLGHDGASKLLHAGVNDLGGTLINENISRASGADHGQHTTDIEFVELIEKSNKKPFLRNTLYTEKKSLSAISNLENVIKL
ncbi:MAG: 5-amino-6-(D-ribitylamino)uracil--L-tyrosine 4-hydroxyphenyl transferase CofH, partial [Actinomycetota bacterium]|nr:5-amino-6-(D-ribitylamino)uracil--L-tyrosine 4-hydroxyphenyl transferase CofH [Actinomycetota bacterium]